MRKIFYVLIIFLFSSCAVSIGNAKKYLPEVNKFISEKKVLVFEFGDLNYISENNKYGRVVYEIPEITQNIVQTGTGSWLHLSGLSSLAGLCTYPTTVPV